MPCIAGHYCPLGTGLEATPCPVTTYLDTTGAAVQADCKPCEKGYICNETGKFLFASMQLYLSDVQAYGKFYSLVILLFLFCQHDKRDGTLWNQDWQHPLA